VSTDRNDDMCKPYFVRGSRLDDGASPFRAVWPTRKGERGTMTCNREGNQPSEGFWWTDRITGDEVFMGFVDDRCQLTCDNPMYRPIFTSSLTTQQNDGSLEYEYNTFFSCNRDNWSGAGTSTWSRAMYVEKAPRFGQYIKNNPDQGRCEQRACYFTQTGWTESGMHAKYRYFDCSEDSVQLENGDWIVPEGSFCTARCVDGFRVFSENARLTCTNPIPFGSIDDAEYQKMLDERFDYFSDSSPIPWGMTGELWTAYKSGSGLSTASKCYKITDQDCGSYPDYKGDENEYGVDWNCDDGVNPGSKCNKRCIGSYAYQVSRWSSPKTQTECSCKGTCKWLSNTTECKAKLCDAPNWRYSSRKATDCYDKYDNRIDYNHHASIGFPEGAYCRDECEVGFGHANWGHDYTTCRCEDDTSCKFSSNTVAYCVQATCNSDIEHIKNLLWEGIGGTFVKDDDASIESPIQPSVEHYSHVECPESAIWSDSGNPSVDGQVKYRSTCQLRCKDGFYLDQRGSDGPAMTCGLTFEFDYEWDLYTTNVDKYGYCDHSFYDIDCNYWPICVPNGYIWVDI